MVDDAGVQKNKANGIRVLNNLLETDSAAVLSDHEEIFKGIRNQGDV